MTSQFPIAVVLAGLATLPAMLFSHRLELHIPRHEPLFKTLFARRRRHVGRRRFWLRARYYLPWVPSPDLEGRESIVRTYLILARVSGMVFIASASTVLLAIGRTAWLLRS
jgi:hypothetical protein